MGNRDGSWTVGLQRAAGDDESNYWTMGNGDASWTVGKHWVARDGKSKHWTKGDEDSRTRETLDTNVADIIS